MLVTQQFPTYVISYDTNGNLIKISECQASGLKHRIIYQEIDWLTHPGTNLNLTGGQMGFLRFSSSTDLVSFLFCFVFYLVSCCHCSGIISQYPQTLVPFRFYIFVSSRLGPPSEHTPQSITFGASPDMSQCQMSQLQALIDKWRMKKNQTQIMICLYVPIIAFTCNICYDLDVKESLLIEIIWLLSLYHILWIIRIEECDKKCFCFHGPLIINGYPIIHFRTSHFLMFFLQNIKSIKLKPFEIPTFCFDQPSSPPVSALYYYFYKRTALSIADPRSVHLIQFILTSSEVLVSL